MNYDTMYAAIKAVKDLKQQQAVAVAKREALSVEAASLPAKIAVAREAVEAAYERDFRGIAEAGELSNAQSSLASLKGRADELAHQDVVASGVINRVAGEMLTAEADLKRRRNELGKGICATIAGELAADKKLRAKLIEALGVSQYQVGGWVIWSALLEELFPAPTDREVEQALDLAVRKYDLPSLV